MIASSHAAAARHAGGWHDVGTRRFVQDMSRALRYITTRRELADLDDRMLADIGLTHEAALSEAARAPWDFGLPRRPLHPGQPSPRSSLPRASAWHVVAGTVRAAWRRHRSRQMIAGLDANALHDIGVSFAEAEVEANKPFWRA
jgi:uncharacterized protein YjiS (DUF1127 family)